MNAELELLNKTEEELGWFSRNYNDFVSFHIKYCLSC